MTSVRFDDLETLQARVSDTWSGYGKRLRITQDMVDRFSALTGDDQWIHTDVERARRESPLGTTIAHGFLLVSLLRPLTNGSGIAIAGHRSVINYGADKLRFTAPVAVGAEIHARQRLAHVRRKGPGTQLTTETEIAAVDAERPAVFYRALVLFLP